MKPTSIIFIIVALIIILSGFIVCRNAERRAESEGIEIFEQSIDESENTVYTFEFGEEEIYNKLELIINEADVYIYGGHAEPYMELINFDEGTYAMTTSNRNISVDTSIDIMSVIKFWESGFSFNGLRNYVRRGVSDEKIITKRVNVYIPSDGDLNVISIKLDSGSVYISNLDTSIDVSLNIKSGDAVFNDVKTDSHIDCELKHGSLYLESSGVGSLSAVMSEGDINADGFEFDNISVTGVKTNVYVSTTQAFDFFDINLSARRGRITINDIDHGGEYDHDSATSDDTIMITVSEGNVIITQEVGKNNGNLYETDNENGGF